MAITYIDTEQCRRIQLPGAQGTMAEIVNRDLCGAKNFVGTLHWLKPGEHFDAESVPDKHQLIYFMEGNGLLTLKGQEHSLRKGAGVYLGPQESASVTPSGSLPLKLFHLVVFKVPQ